MPKATSNATAEQRAVAGKRLRNAVQRGAVSKPARCESCGQETTLQAHHFDYTLPYDVLWLCMSCHKRIHRIRREEQMSNEAAGLNASNSYQGWTDPDIDE